MVLLLVVDPLATCSTASRGAAAGSSRSSAASAAAAAPTRPVLVLAQALVVGLAAPADASGLESSRDVLVGVVREVLLNQKLLAFAKVH